MGFQLFFFLSGSGRKLRASTRTNGRLRNPTGSGGDSVEKCGGAPTTFGGCLGSEEADHVGTQRPRVRSTFPGVAAAAAAAALGITAQRWSRSCRLIRKEKKELLLGVHSEVQMVINNIGMSALKFRLKSEDASPCSGSWLPLFKMWKGRTSPYHSQPLTIIGVATRASVCHSADIQSPKTALLISLSFCQV